MDRERRKRNIFIIVIRLLFFLAIVIGIIAGLFGSTTHNYMNSFTALVGLALTFIPETVEKISKSKMRFSNALQVAIVVFIFLAEFLGEMRGFYYKITWWDTMLHLASGVILGMIGFLMVYVLNGSSAQVKLSPFFVALFAFMFAATAGVVWEIFEFSGDRLLGMNMQKYLPPKGVTQLVTDTWRFDAGLVDTMKDLICDTATALVVSILGYFQAKREYKLEKK